MKRTLALKNNFFSHFYENFIKALALSLYIIQFIKTKVSKNWFQTKVEEITYYKVILSHRYIH